MTGQSRLRENPGMRCPHASRRTWRSRAVWRPHRIGNRSDFASHRFLLHGDRTVPRFGNFALLRSRWVCHSRVAAGRAGNRRIPSRPNPGTLKSANHDDVPSSPGTWGDIPLKLVERGEIVDPNSNARSSRMPGTWRPKPIRNGYQQSDRAMVERPGSLESLPGLTTAGYSRASYASGL
jgi:hypothetical protein